MAPAIHNHSPISHFFMITAARRFQIYNGGLLFCSIYHSTLVLELCACVGLARRAIIPFSVRCVCGVATFMTPQAA
jgi:hypothetical protein